MACAAALFSPLRILVELPFRPIFFKSCLIILGPGDGDILTTYVPSKRSQFTLPVTLDRPQIPKQYTTSRVTLQELDLPRRESWATHSPCDRAHDLLSFHDVSCHL